jgi:hypothetical protein
MLQSPFYFFLQAKSQMSDVLRPSRMIYSLPADK